MGGNAFDGNRRVLTQERNELVQEVKKILHNWQVDDIVSYREKKDHGDIDFIVEPELTEEILGIYFPNCPILSNSYLTSIQYKGVQLDFSRIPNEGRSQALSYFAYNDLGNLIGRVTKNYGFKFGFRGVYYVLRREGETTRDIPVNITFTQALTLFGFNAREWRNGFDNLDQMFQWLAEGLFTDPKMFAYEALDSENRRRNKKRKVYQACLEWFEKTPPLGHAVVTEKYFFDQIGIYDPSFEKKIAREIELSTYRRKAKENFPSARVSEMLGVTQKDLGEAMKYIRETWSLSERANADPETIDWIIKKTGRDLKTYLNIEKAKSMYQEPKENKNV